MKADRYTRAALTGSAAALVVLAARPWFPATVRFDTLGPEPAHAQPGAGPLAVAGGTRTPTV